MTVGSAVKLGLHLVRCAVRKSRGVRVLHPDAEAAMEERFQVWEERLGSV